MRMVGEDTPTATSNAKPDGAMLATRRILLKTAQRGSEQFRVAPELVSAISLL
jgi:hypothetical protein